MVRPDGSFSRLTTFAGSNRGKGELVAPIGTAFAPRGFGAAGGRLLVSDSEATGWIFSVGPDGTSACPSAGRSGLANPSSGGSRTPSAGWPIPARSMACS